MFKQIKARLAEPGVQELLECAAVFDPQALEEANSLYASNEAYELFGYEVDEELVGLIGFRLHAASRVLEIVHLAVRPEERLKGYGRGLVLLALTHASPERLVAVTDEESADFFPQPWVSDHWFYRRVNRGGTFPLRVSSGGKRRRLNREHRTAKENSLAVLFWPLVWFQLQRYARIPAKKRRLSLR